MARSVLHEVADVGAVAEVFEPFVLGLAGDFTDEDVFNDIAYLTDGLYGFLAKFFAVEDEDGIVEFDGLTVFAGGEGEGDIAQFVAEVVSFEPTPVAAAAAHFILPVFSGEVGECSACLQFFNYLCAV